MNKKIVSLYGFYGIDNVGNEAMLKALIEPIREEFGENVEFKVYSRHPSNEYNKLYKCSTLKNLEHDTRIEAKGQWLKGLNPNDSVFLNSFAKNIAFSDLVILGPGQYLVETGAFGLFRGALAQTAIVSQLCKIFDVPLYGVALACEPIKNPWSIIAIQDILDNMKYKNFRDPASIENLTDVGINIPNIEVFGDLALASAPSDINLAEEVMKTENIPPKKGKRLALAHRNLYFLNQKKEVEKNIAKVLEKWLSFEDRDIITVPQNTYNKDDNRDDDRIAIKKLADLIPNSKGKIHFINNERRPEALEAIYGSCDVTLATRLHGSVFSCKQGTPPIVLNCLKKMHGFYKRLGFEQFLFSIDDNADKIYSQLEFNLNNKETLSKEILDRVDIIRGTAKNYSQIAINILKKTQISEKNKKIRDLISHV